MHGLFDPGHLRTRLYQICTWQSRRILGWSAQIRGNTGQVGVPQVPAGLRRYRPFLRPPSNHEVRAWADFDVWW